MSSHHNTSPAPNHPRFWKVAVVDDEESVLVAIAIVLDPCPDLRIVASCPDAQSALRSLPRLAPDLVLMDIHLPGMSGTECTTLLKALLPAVRVLMLTGDESENEVFRALTAGADGYLLKPSSPDQLREAVRDTLAGGAVLSPIVARRMIDFFRQIRRAPVQSPAATHALRQLAGLSPREHQVLRQLAQGLSVKELAAALNISWETVRHHIANIYHKLHVHSRTEAILQFLGHPLAPPSPPFAPGPIPHLPH